MAVGVIAEFNPFHNGHLYLFQKIKELFPEEPLVIILGGNFLERGEVSILNKWDKTELALTYGADLVIELPFVFATQSADYFAHGSISLLKELKVDKIVFGSETNLVSQFEELADIQLTHPEYENMVKEEMKLGKNYPTALSLVLKKLTGKTVQLPNDILALSYIREIKKQKASIKAISIQRTNDYHHFSGNEITSAESIRRLLQEGKEISSYVPKKTQEKITFPISNENYFSYLKYQIMTHWNQLEQFQTVDQDMSARIKKAILSSQSLEELIQKLKTKRYTYNRIQRMLTHILCHFTKEEAKQMCEIEYIRVLGFTNKGKTYLNQMKKQVTIPIITTYSKGNSSMLLLEQRITYCYSLAFPLEIQKQLWKEEYQKGPIQM